MSDIAGFHFLDDIAPADAAFIAYGANLSELFEQAARAATAVMLEDLDQLTLGERRRVDLTDDELEIVLFDFLQEIVYYKDADSLLLLPTSVSVSEQDGGYRIRAELGGEPIDPGRHDLSADIKAVALHQFRVEPTKDGWQAAVVLDI